MMNEIKEHYMGENNPYKQLEDLIRKLVQVGNNQSLPLDNELLKFLTRGTFFDALTKISVGAGCSSISIPFEEGDNQMEFSDKSIKNMKMLSQKNNDTISKTVFMGIACTSINIQDTLLGENICFGEILLKRMIAEIRNLHFYAYLFGDGQFGPYGAYTGLDDYFVKETKREELVKRLVKKEKDNNIVDVLMRTVMLTTTYDPHSILCITEDAFRELLLSNNDKIANTKILSTSDGGLTYTFAGRPIFVIPNGVLLRAKASGKLKHIDNFIGICIPSGQYVVVIPEDSAFSIQIMRESFNILRLTFAYSTGGIGNTNMAVALNT